MYEENYKALANAIILQAVKDFRVAYKQMRRYPERTDSPAANEVRSITRFFCSDYFQLLTDLDGSALLQKIIDDMEEKMK